MPELTVVIPAYRERDNIRPLLDALEKALQGEDWEAIIVVDDAFDGTEEIVRERAQQDPRVRCIHRIGRRGLASACIEGMLASSAPYVAVMDADLQHDESLLTSLLQALKTGMADVAVASRYMAGASTGDLAASRVRISRLASALGRALCPDLTDPMSGFFVLRRSFLERVVRRLYGRGFKILLDLVAAERGVRVTELPYRMRTRVHGESKLGARVVAEFFMLILYHLSGRLVPARFFLFGAVGLTGVGVHLAVLAAAYGAGGAGFLASQVLATWVAMTSNFFLNNAFTYGDRRLHGRRLWRGVLSFYAACGLGAFINVAVAQWLFLQSFEYWLAGLAGALIAAIWNFLTTASVTWGGADTERA